MRNVIVTWFGRLLGLLFILSLVGVVYVAWAAFTSGLPGAWLTGLLRLVGGLIVTVLTYGLAFTLLSINANTRRSADAMEALLRQGGPRRNPVLSDSRIAAGGASNAPVEAQTVKPKPRAVGPVSRDIPRR